MGNRTGPERVAATIRRLETEPNLWVATASSAGRAHLVPLSLAWDGERVLAATPTASPTAGNIRSTGRARASLDSAADVVVMEAKAEAVDFTSAEGALVDLYVARVGWDPRGEPGVWSVLILTPWLVHAWNSVGEIDGRTIMRRGVWTS